jgi:hypothetical protein
LGEDKIAELTIGQLIKIILGLFVVVAVGAGIYLLFKNQILDFFKGLVPENVTGIFIILK